MLTGRVVRSGDPGWEDARKGFDLWAPYDAQAPQAVAFCQSEEDVIHAIRYCREAKVPIRARSGRHNYEAYSSLCKNGVIVDVSDLDKVRVSPDRTTATVGAGIQMLDLFEQLGQVGRTLPLATGPSVGLAGLVLGGGFGITSRKWGLTADNLLSLRLVLADGTAVTASASAHPDLFWACCGGGGGNVGIVTEFTFRIHPIDTVAIFTLDWTWDAFDAVVTAWQQWAPQTDEALTCALALISGLNGQPGSLQLYGQFTPDNPAELAKVQELLLPLISAAPPRGVNIQALPAVNATRVILGVDPLQPAWRVNKHTDNQIFKSTSSFSLAPFPAEAITLLRKALESVPPLDAPPSQPTMVQLLAGGGAIAKPAPDATPIPYRSAHFVVQYDGYWTSPKDARETVQWVNALRKELQPYTVGAYINYMDNDIKDINHASFGPNLERLRKVKHQYDKDNLFDFPQGWLKP